MHETERVSADLEDIEKRVREERARERERERDREREREWWR